MKCLDSLCCDSAALPVGYNDESAAIMVDDCSCGIVGMNDGDNNDDNIKRWRGAEWLAMEMKWSSEWFLYLAICSSRNSSISDFNCLGDIASFPPSYQSSVSSNTCLPIWGLFINVLADSFRIFVLVCLFIWHDFSAVVFLSLSLGLYAWMLHGILSAIL